VAIKDTICEAIADRRLLQFNYHGHNRVVEPHLLGQDRSGNDVLSAYFVSGFTESSHSRRWRRYFVNDIQDLTGLAKRFDGPREGYNSSDPSFVRIHCCLEGL
jgi:hypothetical protein